MVLYFLSAQDLLLFLDTLLRPQTYFIMSFPSPLNPNFRNRYPEYGPEQDQESSSCLQNFVEPWSLEYFDFNSATSFDFDAPDIGDINFDSIGQNFEELVTEEYLAAGNMVWASEISPHPNTSWNFVQENMQFNSPGPTAMPYFTQSSEPGSDSTSLSTSSDIPAISSSTSEPNLPSPTLYSTPSAIKRSHICTICTKPFPNPEGLKRHKKIHDPKIACLSYTCLERFAETKDMKRHVQTNHPGILPRERHYCPRNDCKYFTCGFGRKDHLKRHMEKIHEILKP